MIRGPFVELVVVICLAASGCEMQRKPAQEQAPINKPNVLVIVVDDMGYSDIRAFGGEIVTPTLDRLASEGLRLTNFHVLPSCSPTRSVLLSGMDNHLAGIGTMGELRTTEMEGYPGYVGYLNFEVAALPEVLQAGGYHTYMAGKWHLGDEKETTPHARGFEETFALLPGGGSHWNDRRPLSPPPETMIYSRNGQKVESLPDDFYSTRYYTDVLLEFLEGNRGDGKPFFCLPVLYGTARSTARAAELHRKVQRRLRFRLGQIAPAEASGTEGSWDHPGRRQTIPTSSVGPRLVRDVSPRARRGSPRYGGLRSDG